MKKIVYCLYACYLDVYEDPLVYQYGLTEEDLKEGFRRLVVSNPDRAFEQRLNEKELCLLGHFDDTTGKLELLENPMRLAHLAALFPKGYLARKEQINA